MSNKQEREGEITMNAYAVKPEVPFVTTKALGRTPATKANRDMVEYMDSHEFSFRIDKSTGKLTSKVIEKR